MYIVSFKIGEIVINKTVLIVIDIFFWEQSVLPRYVLFLFHSKFEIYEQVWHWNFSATSNILEVISFCNTSVPVCIFVYSKLSQIS